MPHDTYRSWIEWHVIVEEPTALPTLKILPTRAEARTAAKFIRRLGMKCEIYRADCTSFVKYAHRKAT